MPALLPSRTRWTVERLHTAPQHSARQLERIDSSKVCDLAEELAVEVKFLNTAIFPVGHIDCSLLVDLDRMWQVDLAGTLAWLAPLLHFLAAGSVFQDSVVAVAIRDV